jgi:hypothetical protein
MKYEYECAVHGRFRSDEKADKLPCPDNSMWSLRCNRPSRRVWGFAFKPVVHSHFNTSVGAPISSDTQFKSALARASEEASTPHTLIDDNGDPHLITKAEHNFVPVDWRDKEALGVTNLGLDSTYDRMKAQGRDSDAAKLKKLMDD